MGADTVGQPLCHRCGTLDLKLDQLRIQFDEDASKTQPGVPRPDINHDLCRRCTNALIAWLNPPPDVKASWAQRRLGQSGD